MARYRITLMVDGTNIKAVQKKAVEAFGKNAGTQVKKQDKASSRADRFSDAIGMVEDGKSEIESLKDELQEWYDNLPENFQNGDKGSEITTAIESLQEVYNQLDSAIGSADVSFPAMY